MTSEERMIRLRDLTQKLQIPVPVPGEEVQVFYKLVRGKMRAYKCNYYDMFTRILCTDVTEIAELQWHCLDQLQHIIVIKGQMTLQITQGTPINYNQGQVVTVLPGISHKVIMNTGSTILAIIVPATMD